jgi:hypothetical protein
MTPNGAVRSPRRSRFASGAQVRLELSDGDWIAIRAELTYGQRSRLAAAGLTGIDAAAVQGERLQVDLAAFDIERLVTWVLDWSFTDEAGDPVFVSRESIEALHPDTADEINTALTAYIEAQASLKAPAAPGTAKPAATSPSASASAGPGTS